MPMESRKTSQESHINVRKEVEGYWGISGRAALNPLV